MIVCVIRRLIRIVVELYIQLTPVAKHSFLGPDFAGSGAFLGGAACLTCITACTPYWPLAARRSRDASFTPTHKLKASGGVET